MRLLKGLAGKVLPCGCLVGVYETYRGNVVASIDALAPVCVRHRLHDAIPVDETKIQTGDLSCLDDRSR